MPRTLSPDRPRELVEAATRAFLEKGYRRTQVADVARLMGVAPGTIYLYAENKEALFDLAIRVSIGLIDPRSMVLPAKAPPPRDTLRLIRRTLSRQGRIESLAQALKDGPRGDELEDIARELFEKSARYWLSIKLIERSAHDWPELFQLWFVRWRGRVIKDLTRYFERAASTRGLREPPNAAAAARLVLEMNAYLAIHRHLDPAPTALDDQTAKETFIDAVLNAYSARPRHRKHRRTSP